MAIGLLGNSDGGGQKSKGFQILRSLKGSMKCRDETESLKCVGFVQVLLPHLIRDHHLDCLDLGSYTYTRVESLELLIDRKNGRHWALTPFCCLLPDVDVYALGSSLFSRFASQAGPNLFSKRCLGGRASSILGGAWLS